MPGYRRLRYSMLYIGGTENHLPGIKPQDRDAHEIYLDPVADFCKSIFIASSIAMRLD